MLQIPAPVAYLPAPFGSAKFVQLVPMGVVGLLASAAMAKVMHSRMRR